MVTRLCCLTLSLFPIIIIIHFFANYLDQSRNINNADHKFVSQNLRRLTINVKKPIKQLEEVTVKIAD